MQASTSRVRPEDSKLLQKALRKKEKKLRREKEKLERETLEKQRHGGTGAAQKAKEKEEKSTKGGKEMSSVPSSPRREDGVQPDASDGLAKNKGSEDGKLAAAEGAREREGAEVEEGQEQHKVADGRAPTEPAQLEFQGFMERDCMLPAAAARVASRVLQMANGMGLDEEMRKRLPSLATTGCEVSMEDIQRFLQATWEGDEGCPRYSWDEVLERMPSSIPSEDEMHSAWPINPTDRVQSLERELQNAREKEKVIESRLMEVQGWIHHDDALLEGILSEASTSHSSPK